MKAWDIVGYTGEGYALCPECYSLLELETQKTLNPIFASNEDWEEMTCDDCLETLGDVEGIVS